MLGETDALVLCDEAYQDFGGPTAVPLLARSSRLVVLRTFSKALGMAGLRFGLALAHPAVAREIAKGKLPYNVNVVTLAAAAAALRHQAVLDGARARGRRHPRAACRAARRAAGPHRVSDGRQLRAHPLRAVPAREVFRRLLDEYGILVRDVSGAAGARRVPPDLDRDRRRTWTRWWPRWSEILGADA